MYACVCAYERACEEGRGKGGAAASGPGEVLVGKLGDHKVVLRDVRT